MFQIFHLDLLLRIGLGFLDRHEAKKKVRHSVGSSDHTTMFLHREIPNFLQLESNSKHSIITKLFGNFIVNISHHMNMISTDIIKAL